MFCAVVCLIDRLGRGKMILYHGTHVQNIGRLEPFLTRGNALRKPAVCFTPNFAIALLYIWDRPFKWVSFAENDDGTVVFTEEYDDMLFDLYNNAEGSIYEVDGSNPLIIPASFKGVYTSEGPVFVEKEMHIDNAYDEILKQEAQGKIMVRRYSGLSLEEKEVIFRQTVRAIHMQKLLLPSDYEYRQKMAEFAKFHWPKEWDVASKMSKEEIEAMMEEWRTAVS